MDKKTMIVSAFIVAILAIGASLLVMERETEPATRISELDEEEITNEMTIYWFKSEMCPYCHDQEPYLDEWEKLDAVEVKKHEISEGENQELLQKMLKGYGAPSGGVPATFIGGDYWIGFGESIRRDMEEKLVNCLTAEVSCPGPMERIE